MRVKLTAPHAIDDRVYDTNAELNVDTVTPLMIGLDPEAVAAINAVKVNTFGRWIGRWPNLHLLDDPPIERPLDDPQPTPAVGGQGGPT